MDKYILEAFDLEKKRAKLAAEGKYDFLKESYSSKYPELKDTNTSKLWDKLNINNKTISLENNPMVEERMKIVSKMISGSNIRVLNIGFGSANLEEKVNWVKEKNSWYGIDISNMSVIEARKRFPNMNFSTGSILDIKFGTKTFDYVIALEVLEHIPPRNTFKALREIHRVLKSKGKVILSIPLNEGLENLIKRGINPNAHVRVYTQELIKAELTIAGFKPLQCKQIYAFRKNYKIKSIIVKILPGIRRPNNLIIISERSK